MYKPFFFFNEVLIKNSSKKNFNTYEILSQI